MREKWVQINKIQGFEEVKDCYWISNSDEDKIMNKDTGKILRGYIDLYNYRRANLRTIDGERKSYKFHILKAKAFLYTPNLLGATLVRHLDDCKTNNALENLSFGTRSDNAQDSIRNGHYNYEATVRGGIKGRARGYAKGGAITAKKTSKPVRCIETGIIYPNAYEVERQTGIANGGINSCCRGKYKTAGGFHWEFVNKEELEEVNKNASKH